MNGIKRDESLTQINKMNKLLVIYTIIAIFLIAVLYRLIDMLFMINLRWENELILFLVGFFVCYLVIKRNLSNK